MSTAIDTSSSINQIREAAQAAFDLDRPQHRDEAIFAAVSEILTESGHFTLPTWAPLVIKRGRKTATVHGYDYNEDDGVLTVIRLLDSHENFDLHQPWERELCPTQGLEKAFNELEDIIEVAKESNLPDLEESDPARELCERLKKIGGNELNRLSLSIWTTGELSKTGWKRSDITGFHTEVWDASRLSNTLQSGTDVLTVDFRPYGGIACLLDDSDYEKLGERSGVVLVGKIPGECLADLYFEHRTRLLQQNVRAFLNFAGAVNKGIRETIKSEPERFLSYNNGIATTASGIDLERRAPGLYTLVEARDFQIVNGGQTTAALMRTKLENSADLLPIQVAMKLTLVRPEDLEGLVPKISQFANSQNKVQESDFASNNPWLVKLEDLSRKTEATKDDKSSGLAISWYFERVRGQYNVDVGKCHTGPQKNAFKARNPARCKFGKTELATAAMSWEAEPHIVGLGSQKCFGSFIRRLMAAKDMLGIEVPAEPSDEDFRRLCCIMILKREALAASKEIGVSAYRANVVAYAIALISFRTKGKFPWSEIWSAQCLNQNLVKNLRIALRGCERAILKEAESKGRMPSEFAKKEECWKAVLNAPIDLDFANSGRGWDKFSIMDTVRPTSIVEANEVFFRLSNKDWAIISAKLRELTQNAAYSGCADAMAQYTEVRHKPSPKQARILAKGLMLLNAQRIKISPLAKIESHEWSLLKGVVN